MLASTSRAVASFLRVFRDGRVRPTSISERYVLEIFAILARVSWLMPFFVLMSFILSPTSIIFLASTLQFYVYTVTHARITKTIHSQLLEFITLLCAKLFSFATLRKSRNLYVFTMKGVVDILIRNTLFTEREELEWMSVSEFVHYARARV